MRNSSIPATGLGPALSILSTGALAALLLAGTVACTPEAEERTERSAERTEEELEEAEGDLERAGREVGEELERAGEALERGVEEVGRELEPYARDAEITARVKARLTADPEVNPLRIDVDTVDGRVTLNGKVRTESQREEAEKLARGTKGVVEVINLLEVGPREG